MNPFRGERVNPLPDLLPHITRFLFDPEPQIRLAATTCCISAIGALPRGRARSMVSNVVFESASIIDLFLLGIASTSADVVSAANLRGLFEFLRERCEADHCSASLAMFILMIVPDVWCPVVHSTKLLFEQLIPLLLRRQYLPQVESVFMTVACAEFEAFGAAIKALIASNARDREYVTRLFDLVSRVSFSNPSIVGSRGSVHIATLGYHLPTFSELADGYLAKHDVEWATVSRSGNGLVIGTTEGKIHFFTQRKHFECQMFQAPIDVVSLAPTGRYIAALSYGTRQVRRLELPRNGCRSERIEVVGELGADLDARYVIEWVGEEKVVVRRTPLD
jgi:hypothetical protein